jgi:hypothetical protein
VSLNNRANGNHPKKRSWRGGRGEFIRPNNVLCANEFAPTKTAQRIETIWHSPSIAIFRIIRGQHRKSFHKQVTRRAQGAGIEAFAVNIVDQ